MMKQPSQTVSVMGCQPIFVAISSFLDDCTYYHALSYTWGTGERKVPIIINGCSFSVTAELHNALLHLRRLISTNIYTLNDNFWVDALCINQQDHQEKSIQVALMQSIYRSAYQVIIWLGDATPGITSEVFAMLHSNIQIFPTYYDAVDLELLQCIQDHQWLCFGADMMHRPWWRRMWVIQEIALAQRAVVMCGMNVVDWSKVAVAGVQAQVLDKPAFLHTEEQYRIGDVFLPNVRFKRAYRMNVLADRPMPILELLMNNMSCKATDERDMLFSLVGIATDVQVVGVEKREEYAASSANEKSHIILDYDRSTEQVYTDLVHVLANTQNSLNILSFNGAVKDLSLPSWVPDWTCVWKTHPFILAPIAHIQPIPSKIPNEYPVPYVFNASAGLDPDFTFISNSKLHVTGILFDTITSLSTPYLDCRPPGIALYHILQTWRIIALGPAVPPLDLSKPDQQADKPYIAGGSQSLAFRRCLTTDQTRRGARIDPSSCFFDPSLLPDLCSTERSVADFERLHSQMSTLQPFVDAQRAVNLRVSKRMFMVTGKGYFGIGPAETRERDQICVLSGCSVPFVLRAVGEEWEVIGECFVLGIMDGEAVAMGGEKTRFVLR